MRVVVVTPPAPVLTWDEVRAHTRQEADDERKSHVMALAAAATAHVDGPDGWLGRCLGVQTLEARFDAHEAANYLRLPCPPVIDLVSLDWSGADGAPRSCRPDDVELIGDTIVTGGAAPWSGMKVDGAPLRIRYRAGYEAVPAPLKVAIGMMVQRMEDGSPPGAAVAGTPMFLLRPYQVFG